MGWGGGLGSGQGLTKVLQQEEYRRVFPSNSIVEVKTIIVLEASIPLLHLGWMTEKCIMSRTKGITPRKPVKWKLKCFHGHYDEIDKTNHNQ